MGAGVVMKKNLVKGTVCQSLKYMSGILPLPSDLSYIYRESISVIRKKLNRKLIIWKKCSPSLKRT